MPVSSVFHEINYKGWQSPVTFHTPTTICPVFYPATTFAFSLSKNQTQIDQAPESPSPPPNPFVAVVSWSCSPTTTNLVDDQPEPQPPLFSSPSTNSILVEQRKEDEEKIVSHKLKSPNDHCYLYHTIKSSSIGLNSYPYINRDTIASVHLLFLRLRKGKEPLRGPIKLERVNEAC
jgi:hypothetical protein